MLTNKVFLKKTKRGNILKVMQLFDIMFLTTQLEKVLRHFLLFILGYILQHIMYTKRMIISSQQFWWY